MKALRAWSREKESGRRTWDAEIGPASRAPLIRVSRPKDHHRVHLRKYKHAIEVLLSNFREIPASTMVTVGKLNFRIVYATTLHSGLFAE